MPTWQIGTTLVDGLTFDRSMFDPDRLCVSSDPRSIWVHSIKFDCYNGKFFLCKLRNERVYTSYYCFIGRLGKGS